MPANRSDRNATRPRTTPASARTSAISSADRPEVPSVDSTSANARSTTGIRCRMMLAQASASCSRGCDCTAAVGSLPTSAISVAICELATR